MKTKTIDLTPTWEEICGMVRMGLTNGTTAGRRSASETLQDMARRADALAEIADTLTDAQKERVDMVLAGGRRKLMGD